MKLSEQAIDECVRELKAACRMRINPDGLDRMLALVRPNFEKLLDDKPNDTQDEKTKHLRRWVTDGEVMRDNGRFVGTFAEFFTNRQENDTVEFRELLVALLIVAVRCPAGSDEFRYCENVGSRYREMYALMSEFMRQLSHLPVT